MNRQHQGGETAGARPAQPPAPCEHGTGAERPARRHRHSLVEAAMDTFGLLLRKAWMVSRVFSFSLGKAKVERHGSGRERAGRAGGQAGRKTRALCPAPRDVMSPGSRLGHWCPPCAPGGQHGEGALACPGEGHAGTRGQGGSLSRDALTGLAPWPLPRGSPDASLAGGWQARDRAGQGGQPPACSAHILTRLQWLDLAHLVGLRPGAGSWGSSVLVLHPGLPGVAGGSPCHPTGGREERGEGDPTPPRGCPARGGGAEMAALRGLLTPTLSQHRPPTHCGAGAG